MKARMKLRPPRHVTIALLAFGFTIGTRPCSFASDAHFDVNDVSFLWPVPQSADEVRELISGDELLADNVTTVWPRRFFDQVIKFAQARPESAVGANRISFPAALEELKNWKVAGIRVNPTSLGGSDAMLHGLQALIDAKQVPLKEPIIPGIRLVMQPVTVDGEKVEVHDFGAHVVFNFTPLSLKAKLPEEAPELVAIVGELREIKAMTDTAGKKLGVHPGFINKVPGFKERLRAFLKHHLTEKRFDVVSFMGLPSPGPEPWIFFRVKRDGENMLPTPVGGFFPSGPTSQMLVFPGKVEPAPSAAEKANMGISTSVLFDGNLKPDNEIVPGATAAFKGLKHRDIPDFVANPMRANTLNTDCVSCHTETTRRRTLDLHSSPGIAFPLQETNAALDEKVLPPPTPKTSRASWNVRVFGWGPAGGGKFAPTIVQRAANEAAESVDFINRNFLVK